MTTGKIALAILLTLLTFLAVSSGIMKIALMPQDVNFFGRYGFSNPILIAFGALQLIGGIALAFPRTRFTGAAIVAVTFLVSLAVLLMDGNLPMSIITAVVTLLLFLVMKLSWRSGKRD